MGLNKTSNKIFVIGKDDLPNKYRIKNIKYLDIGFNYKTFFNLFRCFIFLPFINYLITKDFENFRIELTKIYIKKYNPSLIHFQWPPKESLINSINNVLYIDNKIWNDNNN